jgi:hypothetical protein
MVKFEATIEIQNPKVKPMEAHILSEIFAASNLFITLIFLQNFQG